MCASTTTDNDFFVCCGLLCKIAGEVSGCKIKDPWPSSSVGKKDLRLQFQNLVLHVEWSVLIVFLFSGKPPYHEPTGKGNEQKITSSFFVLFPMI